MCRGHRGGSLQCFRVTDSKMYFYLFPSCREQKKHLSIRNDVPMTPSHPPLLPIGHWWPPFRFNVLYTKTHTISLYSRPGFEVRLSNFITLIKFRFSVRWNGHFGQIRVRPTAAHCIYNACTLYLQAHASIRWNAYATLNVIGFSIHNHTPVSYSKFTT